MDERDVTIRNLKDQVLWVQAMAYAALEDMKGHPEGEQLAFAKECLEKFAENFDPEPTPEQRRKWGLDDGRGLRLVPDSEG